MNIFNISSIESLDPTQELGLRGAFETTYRDLPNLYFSFRIEALSALKGAGSAYGSASRPGKDVSLFHIAPLDPVLKDRACGKQAGKATTIW